MNMGRCTWGGGGDEHGEGEVHMGRGRGEHGDVLLPVDLQLV